MTRPFSVIQNVFALVPKQHVAERFLYYLMMEAVPQTGYKGHWPEVKRKTARLPPLPEQRKIAAILSSVDEAIEATQAVIDQVQVVKKGLMQELLTKGLPGRHKTFKQTEIGQIPEAWEVVELGGLLREKIRNGYSPRCPSEPTGRWILHLGAVTADGYNQAATKPAPPNDAKVGAFLLDEGDLLVSRSNTRERVGFAGIYDGSPSPCAYPDLLMRVRVDRKQVLTRWIEACLLSPFGRVFMEARARGTSGSMVKINRGILESFPVPVPTLEEQEKIVAQLSATDARRYTEVECLWGLQEMKQALMSVLLTGELRVQPEATT